MTLTVVEASTWSESGIAHRITICQRPDGLYALRLERFFPPTTTEHGEAPGYWGELHLPVMLADTVDRARELAREARITAGTSAHG